MIQPDEKQPFNQRQIMQLNRIQQQIFKQHCKKTGQDVDEYIRLNAQKYLGKDIENMASLEEEDGDTWINRLYLESLQPSSK